MAEGAWVVVEGLGFEGLGWKDCLGFFRDWGGVVEGRDC